MSDQRVVVAGLVATVMFLVGAVAVLGATGWIHRPGAPVSSPVASSASPPEIARVSATAPSADPVVTSAPVIVATTAAPPPPPIATAVARPFVEGDAMTGSIVTSAPIANAEAAIARLRPSLRKCYNAGLASDPKMSGNFVLSVKVDAAGTVQHVDKVAGSGLSRAVESCIIGKAMTATIDAPGGSGATLQVPVTFAPTGTAKHNPFGD